MSNELEETRFEPQQEVVFVEDHDPQLPPELPTFLGLVPAGTMGTVLEVLDDGLIVGVCSRRSRSGIAVVPVVSGASAGERFPVEIVGVLDEPTLRPVGSPSIEARFVGDRPTFDVLTESDPAIVQDIW